MFIIIGQSVQHFNVDIDFIMTYISPLFFFPLADTLSQ